MEYYISNSLTKHVIWVIAFNIFYQIKLLLRLCSCNLVLLFNLGMIEIDIFSMEPCLNISINIFLCTWMMTWYTYDTNLTRFRDFRALQLYDYCFVLRIRTMSQIMIVIFVNWLQFFIYGHERVDIAMDQIWSNSAVRAWTSFRTG